MKIRTDFVTNSSSSSFIIATNFPVPEKYKDSCMLISKTDILAYYKEKLKYDSVTGIYNENVENDFIKEGKFTEKQVLLMKIIQTCNWEEYIELKEKIKEIAEGTEIYYIDIDNNWLCNNELYNFIHSGKMINQDSH